METVDFGYIGITQYTEIEVYSKIICKINSNIIKGKFSKIACLDQFSDNTIEFTLGKLLYIFFFTPMFSPKKNTTYQKQNLQLNIFILSLHSW